MPDITILSVQRKIKPKIEDVLPLYLDDKMKESALSFVAWMRENKMPLRWAGLHNAWKSVYKGKAICYVRLPRGDNDHQLKGQTWVVTPYLDNFHVYTDEIVNEGMQDFIWGNVFHCMFCRTPCHGYPPGKDVVILEKEIMSVCRGRQLVWAYAPDETEIGTLKRLLTLEQCARTGTMLI